MGYRPELSWQPSESGLVLRCGHQRHDIPDELSRQLRDLLDDLQDPALDLLTVEDLLRRRANELRGETRRLTTAISTGSGRVADLGRQLAGRRWRGRRSRRHQQHQARDDLRQLLADAERGSDDLHHVVTLIDAIRRLVLDLDPDDGLLGEAARGWRRPSTQPAWVAAFASLDEFLALDARRTCSAPWGGTIADAEFFGHGWRRDDDEPDPDREAPALTGPWQLHYLPRTGEIYAVRRCDYLPEEVWLLADHHDDPSRTRSLLSDLGGRKREPNSLLLAAATVHAHAVTPDEGEPA